MSDSRRADSGQWRHGSYSSIMGGDERKTSTARVWLAEDGILHVSSLGVESTENSVSELQAAKLDLVGKARVPIALAAAASAIPSATRVSDKGTDPALGWMLRTSRGIAPHVLGGAPSVLPTGATTVNGCVRKAASNGDQQEDKSGNPGVSGSLPPRATGPVTLGARNDPVRASNPPAIE